MKKSIEEQAILVVTTIKLDETAARVSNSSKISELDRNSVLVYNKMTDAFNKGAQGGEASNLPRNWPKCHCSLQWRFDAEARKLILGIFVEHSDKIDDFGFGATDADFRDFYREKIQLSVQELNRIHAIETGKKIGKPIGSVEVVPTSTRNPYQYAIDDRHVFTIVKAIREETTLKRSLKLPAVNFPNGELLIPPVTTEAFRCNHTIEGVFTVTSLNRSDLAGSVQSDTGSKFNLTYQENMNDDLCQIMQNKTPIVLLHFQHGNYKNGRFFVSKIEAMKILSTTPPRKRTIFNINLDYGC